MGNTTSKIKFINRGNENSEIDDQLLESFEGLKKIGCTSKEINFLREKVLYGANNSPNTNSFELLKDCVREYLEQNSKRIMAVIEPLTIVILNIRKDDKIVFEEDGQINTIAFGHEILIDRSNFQIEFSEDFAGLCPGKIVKLRHAGYVYYSGYQTDAFGEIIKIFVTYVKDYKETVSNIIDWIPTNSKKVQIREFENLFGETLDISQRIKPTNMFYVYIDNNIFNSEPFDKYELDEIGFISVQCRNNSKKIILNKII